MGTNETAALLFCCMGIIIVLSLLALTFFIPKYYQQKRAIAILQSRFNLLSASALDGMRLQWMQELPHYHYRNEIEVEIKVIYPMLRFLGYDANDLHVRVHVPIQVGRQAQNSAADWVVMKNGKPFFVIEAKKHDQSLNNEVLAQARSYAYGLNLNLYVVTNGTDLEIYSRGTERDTMVMGVRVNEIGTEWENIKKLIGK